MSATLSPINSINPASAEVLARFDPFTPDEVDHALDQAEDAFIAWRERSFEERAVPMRRLAALLRERADRYGRLITLEMGKPIVEARAELEKCAWGCEHYAEHAARYLADEVITTNARTVPAMPNSACQKLTLRRSSCLGAISGNSDSNGPPDSVAKRWNADTAKKR